MFKLVRVLENVQLKGAKGCMTEGNKRGGRKQLHSMVQSSKGKITVQISSKEIHLFKTYIEMISSYNTEQDSFRNRKQAILQCNVSKCPKFYISSDLRWAAVKITLAVDRGLILSAQKTHCINWN